MPTTPEHLGLFASLADRSVASSGAFVGCKRARPRPEGGAATRASAISTVSPGEPLSPVFEGASCSFEPIGRHRSLGVPSGPRFRLSRASGANGKLQTDTLQRRQRERERRIAADAVAPGAIRVRHPRAAPFVEQ
jgi:hypothetical protein